MPALESGAIRVVARDLTEASPLALEVLSARPYAYLDDAPLEERRTPTHTRRRGRLYRYYICLGASRRGHDTCPVRSIADSEVEALVLGQVRRLLASPELVARTITAVRRENGAAEDTELEESDVIEALGALEPGTSSIRPSRRAFCGC